MKRFGAIGSAAALMAVCAAVNAGSSLSAVGESAVKFEATDLPG
jgi:hypothetical protein